MRVVLLGTGTPNAKPDRSGTPGAVIVGKQAYLVDLGPGVVRQAVAASRSGIAALAPPRLTRGFVTHLHSDHTAGPADTILIPWVLEREEPLLFFGPPGLSAMVEHLLAAYQADIRERIEGLEPANETRWQTIAHETEGGKVYRDDCVTVEAFPVDHGSWCAR